MESRFVRWTLRVGLGSLLLLTLPLFPLAVTASAAGQAAEKTDLLDFIASGAESGPASKPSAASCFLLHTGLIEIPSGLPQARYLEAMCWFLNDAEVELYGKSGELRQRKIELESRKSKQASGQGNEIKVVKEEENRIVELETRSLALDLATHDLKLRHTETLERVLQDAIKQAPFSEAVFWASWDAENERYANVSVPFSELAIDLNGDLFEALHKYENVLTQALREVLMEEKEMAQQRLDRMKLRKQS